MTYSSLVLRLAALIPLIGIGSSLHAQDAEELAKARASLPDAVRKVADASGEAVKGAVGKITKPKTDASDPSKWGKEEVHKLAVMDVDFGGNTETIIIELYPNAAPKTVANFSENATSGAYRGLAFHRAITDYLVQTGDPLTSDDSKRSSWGTGGEDKTVPAEIKLPHKPGSVVMARRSDKVNPDRRSNGYQFYFALGNLSSLDGAYTVFGQVVSGLDVIQSISRVPVDSNDCPLSRIEVKSIRITDQKGPLIVMGNGSGSHRRFTKPSSAKSALTRFIERVW